MVENSRLNTILAYVVLTLGYSLEFGGRDAFVDELDVEEPHRGKGLGSVLLWHSLRGFRQAGIDRVYLEVTAQNSGACRLYERLGFRRTKVVYKASEVAYAEW